MKVPFLEIPTEKCGNKILASTCRKPTELELEEKRKLFEKGECDHSIIYDTPGYMYDIRACYFCDTGLGLI